ncbi:MAG TPA: hypothetical protein VMV72_18220 [Verrucomicrobiae bacterium]|nr:hypothetical protein [Verrucomicrobiae bacterium]
MSTRRFSTGVFPANIRLVSARWLLGLLLVFAHGCTTVQTDRAGADESLRSRMVAGSRREIFNLVKQVVYREFGRGRIRTDPDMGEITARVPNIITGDAVLMATVIERPGDLVEVSVSAHGFGPAQQRAAVARFLADFDENYAMWLKYRTSDRGPIE